MIAQAAESFGWAHFATLAPIFISLVAVAVSLWSNRKSDAQGKFQIEQSAGCKYDHEGIRGILVAQGAALTELVKQQAEAVRAFSTLANSLTLNHRDILEHNRDVTRILNDIAEKFESR
jgi:hypothetical protein